MTPAAAGAICYFRNGTGSGPAFRPFTEAFRAFAFRWMTMKGRGFADLPRTPQSRDAGPEVPHGKLGFPSNTGAVMAQNSSIEWTEHTFNPWWGCVKVSGACKNCYACAFSRRLGLDIWGPDSDRRFFDEEHWRQPLLWNARAERSGVRMRVFSASMADVFEERAELDPWRAKLWTLIEATPHLDWLLLTKRPQLIAGMVPWGSAWPANAWIGTTVEDQKCADERLPHLASLPAIGRFVSAEPLQGPVDIFRWLEAAVDWVIAGGESGARAEPSSPAWFRSLRDQCEVAGVPFLFKQWGEWVPERGFTGKRFLKPTLRTVEGGTQMLRVTTAAAGRTLDGREWDEVPHLIAPRTLVSAAASLAAMRGTTPVNLPAV